jgi:hypothetical protein
MRRNGLRLDVFKKLLKARVKATDEKRPSLKVFAGSNSVCTFSDGGGKGGSWHFPPWG